MSTYSNTPDPTPIPLDSMVKLKAVRRPVEPGEVLKSSDCLCLAPFEGKGYKLWISSPNMEFVPEVPMHKWGEIFSFYADGMMGSFELFKWPQVYDDLEPHACASPGNPALLTNLKFNARPIMDSKNALPSLGDDAQLVWAPFDQNMFEEINDTGTAHIGFLSRAVLSNLKAATHHAREQAILLAQHLYAHKDAVDEKDQQARDHRRRFMWQIILRLQRCLSHLQEVPMSSFEVILWFREAQRLLLELQAWVNYHAVIKPRIDDPQFDGSKDVLPLRGVITTKPLIVDTMLRAGVPVWWVRPSTSLSSAMRVIHVQEWVPSIGYLSNKRTMHHGLHSVPAPTWVESSIIDNSMRGLADHIRRFSLTSRPIMSSVISALGDDSEDLVSGLSTSHSMTGQNIRAEPPRKKAKSSKAGLDNQSSNKKPSLPLEKPHWVPNTDEPWADILRALPELTEVHPGEAILYAFPPISLFFVTGTMLAMRIHNWIRVRTWWFGQALNSLNNRAILMTANYWRIALEGNYFRIKFNSYGTDIQPRVTAEDIDKLPLPSVVKASGPKPHSHNSGSSSNQSRGRPDRRSLRRTAKRLEISVHFGVHGGFSPYQQSQRVNWRDHLVNFADISNIAPCYGEIIVWELSVLNFRVDLCLGDRVMLPSIYESKDNILIIQREDALRTIWDKHGSMRPHWEHGQPDDDFGNLISRGAAFARLAQILADWPGAAAVLPNPNLTSRVLEGTEDSEATQAFTKQVGIVYCRMYHSKFARLPTMPLQSPESIRLGADN